MSKKYFWKINGRLYEVSEEQYYEYRKEQDRHNYLKKFEQEAVIMSFDSLGRDGNPADSFIPDPDVHIEDDIIHKMLLEKLNTALSKLSAEELLLIDLLYSQAKSEREAASVLGISQKAVNKRKAKLLARLKNFLEK